MSNNKKQDPEDEYREFQELLKNMGVSHKPLSNQRKNQKKSNEESEEN